MANRRFVTIDNYRHDITGMPITQEQACDRCAKFMAICVAITVPPEILQLVTSPVRVEICLECARLLYPGLPDLAQKVLTRD